MGRFMTQYLMNAGHPLTILSNSKVATEMSEVGATIVEFLSRLIGDYVEDLKKIYRDVNKMGFLNTFQLFQTH